MDLCFIELEQSIALLMDQLRVNEHLWALGLLA